MTVLLTGAVGMIGTEMAERLPALGWTLRCFDRVGAEGPGFVRGDLTSPDDLDRAVAGDSAVTAIVHLAGQPTEAPWSAVREDNVEGTFQLFEAARRHRVTRVVFASSNHAVGFTPLADEPLPGDTPPRPDTLYGVSKVFGEALGRYYADRYGIRVACLRIGTFAQRPPDRRALSTWLSPGDCARLIDACLRAPQLSYALLWGISANTRRRWSIEDAVALGYQPRDDAERYADQLATEAVREADGYVGGVFTSSDFDIDEVIARDG